MTLNPDFDLVFFVGLAVCTIGLAVMAVMAVLAFFRAEPQPTRGVHAQPAASAPVGRVYPTAAIDHYARPVGGPPRPYRDEDSFAWGFLAGQLLPYPMVFGGPNHMLGMMAAHLMMDRQGSTFSGWAPVVPSGAFSERNFCAGVAAGDLTLPVTCADGPLDRDALIAASAALAADVPDPAAPAPEGGDSAGSDDGSGAFGSASPTDDGGASGDFGASGSTDSGSSPSDYGSSTANDYGSSSSSDYGSSASSCDFSSSSSCDSGSSF